MYTQTQYSTHEVQECSSYCANRVLSEYLSTNHCTEYVAVWTVRAHTYTKRRESLSIKELQLERREFLDSKQFHSWTVRSLFSPSFEWVSLFSPSFEWVSNSVRLGSLFGSGIFPSCRVLARENFYSSFHFSHSLSDSYPKWALDNGESFVFTNFHSNLQQLSLSLTPLFNEFDHSFIMTTFATDPTLHLLCILFLLYCSAKWGSSSSESFIKFYPKCVVLDFFNLCFKYTLDGKTQLSNTQWKNSCELLIHQL